MEKKKVWKRVQYLFIINQQFVGIYFLELCALRDNHCWVNCS